MDNDAIYICRHWTKECRDTACSIGGGTLLGGHCVGYQYLTNPDTKYICPFKDVNVRIIKYDWKRRD